MTTKNDKTPVPPDELVEWRAVPPRRRDRGKSRVTLIVEELTKHPNKSARVVRGAKSTSATAAWKKHDGIVAQIRQAEDDPTLYDVYAWWNPEKAAEDAARRANAEE